jgi:hypothetical protein
MPAPISRTGLILYVTGVTVMLLDIAYGRQIQDEVAALGIAGMQAKYGDAGGLKLLLFAFAFPLGVGVSLLGAALFGGTAATRAGRFGGLALFVILVPILVPGVFGTQHSAPYFGYGGMTILLLVAAAMWFWGHYRRRLSDAMRPAADWQGLGLLAFALAAWNLCGFGGMPGFAVHPEKMIALNAVPFAVGQLKAVMALFILGWIFTVLGLRRAARALPRP